MSNRSEVFPEEEVRRWGRYSGAPTDEQLSRFFTVAPGDFERAGRARSTATRLGYAVQLCTVRFLGAFLPDPAQTPSTVVTHVAVQMGADPRAWSDYVGSRARLVHQGAIRRDYGYVVFGDGVPHVAFLRWLWGRAWTGDDPPAQLVDLATGWLVEHQVLLPGFSILQRLCASARDRAERRVWRLLARQLSAEQSRRLERLLVVGDQDTVSELEALRRPPRQPTITGVVLALERLGKVQGLGGHRIRTDVVPAGRLNRLATEAFEVRAQRIARRPPLHRRATLAAFAHRLHAHAHDDVVDILLLVLGEVAGRIERLGATERLRSMGELDDAALVLAQAARVLLDETITEPAIRLEVFTQLARTELEKAVTVVERVVTVPAERLSTGLDRRYPSVRRFLPELVRLVSFDATTKADPVLAAVRHLVALERGTATMDGAPLGVVSPAWRSLVQPKADLIDRRSYTLCTLEALRHAIRRRDVFVPAALRWGDPRRLLLDKATWRANQAQVLRSLDLTGGAGRFLDRLGDELDAAYHHAAAVVARQPELIVFDHDVGRQRFKIPPLDALDVPESTTALRDRLSALLPAAELPEVMLEVDAWTGFSEPMTDNVTGGETRAGDLAVSVCAVLVVQACNVPYSAVARRDVPALTEARLRWVEENYVRADTITAANARLVDHQCRIPLVAHWGGGQLTSADGMRFVVPVRSIHAAPNPRYFGAGRGITLFNYVADNFLGWANIVITGTKRDSQFLLDRILDNPTTLDPKEIMTDTASASDLVFGLCQLLGFRYSPRLADLPSWRLFRLSASTDYGVLGSLSRRRINTALIREHWDDICRVAGTLQTKAAVASEVIQALQRGGRPTTLARALAEIGRVSRTIAILDYVTNPAQRRRILVQLNRQETRHQLARDVFHGRRGHVYQAYRPGQEQQLGALGLVTNVLTLWNSGYMNHAVDHLRAEGIAITDEDLEHLSPLQHEQVNLHGRYVFSTPDHLRYGLLRPLTTQRGR